MKARRPSKGRRTAVNLTFSDDTIRKGRALMKTLHRPSISNVVEHLIQQASEQEMATKGANGK